MLRIDETLYIGDVVRMRKPHPCGGYEWTVTRVGADIGIVCQTCGHRVLMPRRKFARAVKAFVRRGSQTIPSPDRGKDTPHAP